MPIDDRGRLLLPQSSAPGELWPIILAKAICVVLSPSYNLSATTTTPEFGEMSVIQMVTGWAPEQIALDAKK